LINQSKKRRSDMAYKGERYYFIDKETYRVEKGMVVLVKRNQIHKTSMAQKSYHDRILVHLREEIFDPFLKANGLFTLEELFETNYGVLGIRPEDWEQTGQLLMQIHRELKRKMGNYQMMVKMKMAEILLLLYRNRKTAKFVQESQKVLTAQLREMERSGLLTRTVYPEVPPRVEYTLTDLGYSLKPILDAMRNWGEAYKAQKQG
jgi:hypothetical protein